MSTRHSIGRLTVEVPARQQEIGNWVRSDGLWRDISNLFDQLVPADVILTIPRLELTIEAGSESAFRQQLQASLHSAVERLVQSRNPLAASVLLNRTHLEQLVWHFLETGVLPWHTPANKAPTVAAFLNDLTDAGPDDFVASLPGRVRQNPGLWLRLVYAVGLEKARRLVLKQGRFSTLDRQWLTETAERIEQTQGPGELAPFWREALIHSSLAQTDALLFRQTIRTRIGQPRAGTDRPERPNTDPATTPPDDTEPARDWPQPDTFYVPNAGLVLLAQFLPTLFARLDLLDAGDFRQQDARFRAIHLLQYLATGALETYEYDLTLNKVLCGLPLTEPVPRWVQLTETDLAEADQLLVEAIQHWSVLRNTSVAGLQETFLQRTGKLVRLETGGWQLQVERKTVDILLDRLPMGWGYSVVSLPWMPKLIFVEW